MAKDSKVKSEGIDVPKIIKPPSVIDLDNHYLFIDAMPLV